MRLGILAPVDISSFTSYFQEKGDLNIIKENSISRAASAVHTLVHAFIEAGHHVCVFTLSKFDFKIQGKGIDIYGVKQTGYPLKYLWGNFVDARRLKVLIGKNIDEVDILHAHWSYTYAYAVTSFTKIIPVFCTVRDWASYIWTIEPFKNKITWSFKYLMNELVFKNRSIHFISNSPYTQALIKNKYGIDTPLIPNPIRSTFISKAERKQPDRFELLCISSSNDKRKNIKSLLLAFKQVRLRYPDANLSLVGSPFTKDNITVQAWEKQLLLQNVSLVGAVRHEDLAKYFDDARIFVTPSIEETFGNTLLEAMARKVPIVAGKESGAIPYVLRSGKAGFLCDVQDVSNLANMLEYVYNNINEAKEKTDWGYNLLINEYEDSVVVNKHISLYESYLQS